LSKTYGWTPQQIGKLTMDQVVMYLGTELDGLDDNESTAIPVGSWQEAREKLAEINALKEV